MFHHVSRYFTHHQHNLLKGRRPVLRTWLFDNRVGRSQVSLRYRSAKLAAARLRTDGGPPGNWDRRTRYLGLKQIIQGLFLTFWTPLFFILPLSLFTEFLRRAVSGL
jgi:hypothetical protein